MEDELDFLKHIFAEECENNITKIRDVEKVALCEGYFISDELNKLLRMLHSIKGSSSMMGYMGITQVAHSLEELFIYLKDNDVSEKEFNYIINLSELALNYILKETKNIQSNTVTLDYGYSITKFINDFLTEKSFENENHKFLEKLRSSNEKRIKPYILKKKDFYILEEKAKRLIHILSLKLEKKVSLKITGTDIVVSENINDKISIAVVQILKNSIDHGIELPEERVENGKNPDGNISIDISEDNDLLIVKISDDGRGLDKDFIFETALKKGILSDSIENYTDSQIYSFIMYPGFTTKSSASMFSGRGIGLDASNGAICSVGGNIKILSEKGKGTTFVIKIPLK